jgi:predicted DNA-binding antitoxin AbrB/MazE fold protein
MKESVGSAYMDTIHAIYENGVFRPIGAVQLPDRSEVELTIQASRSPSAHPELARLLEITEQFGDNAASPTDRAAQHDHYLFGTPKRP